MKIRLVLPLLLFLVACLPGERIVARLGSPWPAPNANRAAEQGEPLDRDPGAVYARPPETSDSSSGSSMAGTSSASSQGSAGVTSAVALKQPSIDERYTRIPNLTRIEHYLLQSVNQDRRAVGLGPVAWDAVAADAGRRHAVEMAAHDFMSHWNQAGYGPDYRYSRAGGTHTVMENVFSMSRLVNGRPEAIQDFMEAVRTAHRSLMTSPGHRQNILAPEHTHMGAGFAHNPKTGKFYLAQEFVNQYVALDPLPHAAQVGEVLTVSGRLLEGSGDPNINVAFQPVPDPMTVRELNKTSAFRTPAALYLPLKVRRDGDRFWQQVPLNYERKPGLYSIRVWVTVQRTDVLAAEWMVDVR